jgi:hypothetical protein
VIVGTLVNRPVVVDVHGMLQVVTLAMQLRQVRGVAVSRLHAVGWCGLPLRDGRVAGQHPHRSGYGHSQRAEPVDQTSPVFQLTPVEHQITSVEE